MNDEVKEFLRYICHSYKQVGTFTPGQVLAGIQIKARMLYEKHIDEKLKEEFEHGTEPAS